MYPPSRGVTYQYGSGVDFPVYRGVSRQYGYGLGSIFKTAMRTVVPILKPLAKAGLQSAKQVAKEQGVGALRDLMEGNNVKAILKTRGKEALKNFGRSALDHLVPREKNIRQHKPKKAHSSSRRQPVHIKKRRPANKKYSGLTFERDIFD